MLTVNVVVLAGTVAADPVTRRMPSGDEVTELRISVPEPVRSRFASPHGIRETPGNSEKRCEPLNSVSAGRWS